MDIKGKYQFFLIQYHAGVACDLPTISPFARDLARRPRTRLPSMEQLTRAFQTDPFLAAKLTGASNSVFFGQDHSTVLTVPEALQRVGARYAMNLIWEAPAFPNGLTPATVAPLWAHCMAVAHLARSIAANARQPVFEPDVAHLVGLIHDIGYLLQLSYSPNTWADIAHQLKHEESDRDSTPHELQGEELARFWSLPALAVAAIRSHHEPHTCSDARARWLASVIGLSESLLRRTSSPARLVAGRWAADALREELGVARELLPALRADALRMWHDCTALARRTDNASAAPRLQLIRPEVKDE